MKDRANEKEEDWNPRRKGRKRPQRKEITCKNGKGKENRKIIEEKKNETDKNN